MTMRFTLQPDPRYQPLASHLHERMNAAAGQATPDTFADLLDSLMRGLLVAAFEEVGAGEGTVWLVRRGREPDPAPSAGTPEEPGALIPAFNSGPDADRLVGKFVQPLSRGIVSMVVVTEQPFCENEVYQHEDQDKTLDMQLGVRTCSMIVVPLYFGHGVRGVVSCVQLKAADDPVDPPGFTMEHMARIRLATETLGRLIDHRLLSVTVGWERE